MQPYLILLIGKTFKLWLYAFGPLLVYLILSSKNHRWIDDVNASCIHNNKWLMTKTHQNTVMALLYSIHWAVNICICTNKYERKLLSGCYTIHVRISNKKYTKISRHCTLVEVRIKFDSSFPECDCWYSTFCCEVANKQSEVWTL